MCRSRQRGSIPTARSQRTARSVAGTSAISGRTAKTSASISSHWLRRWAAPTPWTRVAGGGGSGPYDRAEENTMSGDKKTLYERLGGYDAIAAVANDLLPRL